MKNFSTREEKFRISARPCNILYNYHVIITFSYLQYSAEFGDIEETTEESEKPSMAENTASYKSPDQLSDELVTLSLLPQSRWRHLTSLELIKVI